MGETVRLRAVGEVPAYRPGLVAALDIGSSKIACLIGRAEHSGLRILGAALREAARPSAYGVCAIAPTVGGLLTFQPLRPA